MIDWMKCSDHDVKLAHAIGRRAVRMGIVTGSLMNLEMDILAANDDIKIDLERLYNSERDLDFGHDIIGIQKNINRKTGKLENFFVPRFAKKTRKALK